MSMRRYHFCLRSLTAVVMVMFLVLPAALPAADEAAGQAAGQTPAPGQAPGQAAEKPATQPGNEAAEEAAEYDVMPLPPWALGDTPQDKKRRSDLDVRKEAILRGSEPFDSQETKDYLQSYYTRYYFPLLTHPKHIGDWPDFRVKFLRTLSIPTLQEPPLLQVHDFLVELTYQAMIPLIRGNYHPAVRCNAMLMLGQLNSQDPLFIGDKKRPPVPRIESMKVMLDELANPKQIDGVKAAALVGILRHVEIDRQLADTPPGSPRRLVGNAETLIADAMLKLVNEKDAPEGRSREGHDWMRRRAVEVLGYLGTPGQNNTVVTALDGVLTDINAPVSLRCSAAEALGRLKFPANANIAVPDTAKKLASVAVFACKREAKRVEDQEAQEAKDKLQASGGMGYGMGGGYMDGGYGAMMPGGMPGMMPGGMSDMPGMMPGGMPGYGTPSSGKAPKKFNPLGYRVKLTRQRIAYEMLLVKRGLLGPDTTLKPAAAPPAAAAAKTSATAPPAPPKAGLSALAKADADQELIAEVVRGIDAIIGVVNQSSWNEMKPMVEELRGKVRQMEDKCGIVVELPQEAAPGAAPGGVPANPLELPPEIPGLELPAMPGQKPAEGAPEKAPAGKPAAPAPDAKTPAAPPAEGPAPAAAAAGKAPPAAPAGQKPPTAPAGAAAEPPAGKPPAPGAGTTPPAGPAPSAPAGKPPAAGGAAKT